MNRLNPYQQLACLLASCALTFLQYSCTSSTEVGKKEGVFVIEEIMVATYMDSLARYEAAERYRSGGGGHRFTFYAPYDKFRINDTVSIEKPVTRNP